jgi:hypothetical protein
MWTGFIYLRKQSSGEFCDIKLHFTYPDCEEITYQDDNRTQHLCL